MNSNGDGMFNFNAFGGMPNANQYFQPSQGFSGATNSYSLSEHNSSKRVKNPLASFNVFSHNNKVEIASTVDNVIV